MITRFTNGVGCMVCAVVCVGGAYLWGDILDNWWMASLCMFGAIGWTYNAMRVVE